MSHTPGDWTLNHVRPVFQRGESSPRLAYVGIFGPQGESVAQAYDVRLDDANLICAAPALLAACQEALTELERALDPDTEFDPYRLSSLVPVLREAIAKAETAAATVPNQTQGDHHGPHH